MQIVYLSARPDVLRETLDHVQHFAPFIDDVVIVAPSRLASRFDGLGTVLTDEDVSGRTTTEISATSHSSRNYMLRAAMLTSEAIDDRFIMSDDDSRPLVHIDDSTFLTADGRYRRRWFHTIGTWRRNTTDFDACLLHSWVILRQMGFANPLAYASHMPQVIDKALALEVVGELAPYAEQYSLDEWSTYFTVAADKHPERFAEPEPFVTLGWPQYPGEWPHQVSPPQHVFENHHPELHDDGGLYDGLPTGCDAATIDATNLEKIMRWYRLDISVRDLEFPDDVDQPWTSPSSGRKMAFKGLKAARSAYRYVNLDERSRIADLEGRIHQLEQQLDS